MITRFAPNVLREFLKLESAGGIIMLAATALALFSANSFLAEGYQGLIHYHINIGYDWPLSHWVSEVLMVIFFLVVGLELKREMAEGFLSKREQIALPLLAALGGMAIPALIFVGINAGTPENLHGWAIPAATDIAFAICVLTLVGRGVPPSVKIFLLAIAIFDDLGAILIIAFFYSGIKSVVALGLVALGIAILALLNRAKVNAIAPYILTCVYLWFCLHEAGVHTTIAGVLTGLFMPTKGAEGKSAVDTLLHTLHPYVAFGIMPLFAFVSAGVALQGLSLQDALSPLPLGIAAGLFFGKQIGIFGVTWLVIKSGLASMPEGATWKHIYGVSILAGIGFTMSLFIGLLAFTDPTLQDEVKIGVLTGSLLSTIWGAVVLKWARG
ncbi:MAG: Na+/H+ antiporter NhaA [Alphaproteobacteria bacterium]|nr:Na+/H+ antiporter NhaA [Alphaproteobacteria bacterium]